MGKKLKKHIAKENKYVTLLIISNASKQFKRIKFPKWIRYPISIVLIGIIATFFYHTYNTFDYILSLENKVNNYNIQVETLTKENDSKNKKISNLEEINKKHYESLQKIKDQTEKLKEQFKNLEQNKDTIINKLNTTKKTTDTKPNNISKTDTKSESNTIASIQRSVHKELRTQSKINFGNFEEQVYTMQEDLANSENIIKNEFSDYKTLNNKVDEIIPYWNAYPSIFPTKGRISSPFGWRKKPLGHGYEFHKGLDIANNYGADIVATGSGTVIFSGYQHGYGYVVIINHGYGITTRYAHSSKLLVKVGDKVKRGDIIAKIGSTGKSTGPHVHYEVRINNIPKNPLNFIYKEDKTK